MTLEEIERFKTEARALNNEYLLDCMIGLLKISDFEVNMTPVQSHQFQIYHAEILRRMAVCE